MFTVAPVVNGLAPLGLSDYLNSGGAIVETSVAADGAHAITLRTGGHFVAWCEKAPAQVTVNDEPAPFTFEPVTGRLDVSVPTTRENARIRLRLSTAA
jgi:hypothetical protein